jgi:DNA adenine methylase
MSNIAAAGIVGKKTVKPTQPFVKVTGGKRKLVPEILQVLPLTFGTYHEPFLGGGALFFALKPEKAILSDLNGKLINVYKVIRNDVDSLIRHLKKYKNSEKFYYKIRARNFDVGTPVERAADYIYCNRTGFNGMFRENRDGQFNIPFGSYANPTICDEVNLRNVSRALKGVTILHESFMKLTDRGAKSPKADDLVYFDPPYEPISETSSFVGFTKAGFGREDQIKLRDLALTLKRKGVHVVLSHSSADYIRGLYSSPEFTITEVQAARAVNSDGAGRGKITELLIY